MAAREPIQPPPERERTDYTVVEHRSSSGMWAFVVVLVLLLIGVGLYAAGVFNGRPLWSEKNNVNIKVAPSNTGGGSSGGTSGNGGP